ncbi:MAG: hypothetical protein B7733_25755 [Myxococcales bacterium FL481]|nr:MAG: hypothetical protein B7733_25755 [Myxococcales bacterium FL481]
MISHPRQEIDPSPVSKPPGEPADSLRDLNVLVLDAQATGANPERGALLELGWGSTAASHDHPIDARSIESHVVALPPGHTVPPPVRRITGITPPEIAAARTREDVWRRLEAAASHTRPTVVHFARFERPFLLQLHLEQSPASPCPFDLVCTHEIARRLLPELPRRGLRALAGYLGHSTADLRRAAEHVAATAFVWRRLVERLDQRERVQTLAQLRTWLAQPFKPAKKRRHMYPMPKGKRLAVPHSPGVYRMLRRDGDVLYVGKATSLHTRVNSYFRRQRGVPDRTLEMLSQAHDLAVTPTATALEAALLELDEIKRTAPPYNVAFADGARHVWFAASGFASWQISADGDHRQGPFVSPEPFEALVALATALSHPEACDAWADAVRLPDQARDHVRTAWRTHSWLARWSAAAGRGSIRPGDLLHDAHRRHAQQLAHADRASEPPPLPAGEPARDEVPPHPTEGEDEWTPERVARVALASLSAAAWSWRRARWWCALAESTLVFGEHRLAIEHGSVADVGRTRHGRPAPVPTHWRRSMTARQHGFDRTICDRLRVLTTELRREVTQRQHVELRFGPTRALDRARLIRALRWV